MTNEKNRKILTRTIEKILQQGMELSPDALHYIDSTFSNPTLEELEKILTAESNSEKDSLMELLFFPDQSVQIQLEDLLESCEWNEDDEKKLQAELSSKQLKATLRFPAGRGQLMLAVPSWTMRRFITHLNVSKKLSPALVKAICRRVPEQFQSACKVKLRNARFRATENKIAFLCALFEKMEAESDIVMRCFALMLTFMEEFPDDGNIFEALMQKKRFYFQNLQKARRFEEQIKHSNMETLIMQGVKIPYIDIEDARIGMELIDRVCYAVFGKSDYLGSGYGDIDLGEFRQEDGLETVIKILS